MNDNRYSDMPYVRCGRSGLRLSRVAFGLWHNFGTYDDPANMRRLVCRAFDLGITHFDLANNYGYVDIFYSHRPDPETPLQETMGALSELALKWCLRDSRVTSVLVGASRVSQLEENLNFLKKPEPDPSEWAGLEALIA